jgi:MFS family permease
MQRFRAVIPALPRRAWILLAGDTISFFGNGLVMPFTIVYLTRARGIEIEVAGLAIGARALVGVAAGPFAGALVDRVGSRRVLFFATLATALGMLAYAWVHEPWQAFVAAGISGLGFASFWPSMQSLLSSVVEARSRSAVFAVHYAALNLGIGIGGILGGFIADIHDPSSFVKLYIADSLTFLPLAVLLMTLLRGIGNVVQREDGVVATAGSYLDVFKDRVFVRVFILMAVLTSVGYSQLESSFPAYATGEGGIGTAALGIAFAGNTFFIVIAQLLILKRIEGMRRTRAIVVLSLSWALCWLITVASGSLSGGIATGGFVLAMVVFAFGETLLSPTMPAIVNDLAPDALRGRYNAMYSLSWNGGTIVGPVIAGVFLGAGLAVLFFFGLIAACGLAAVMAVSLERHLPERANRISEISPA